MKSTLAAALACAAMLATGPLAGADDVSAPACQCWQENLADVAAFKDLFPGISACNTRCKCRGLPIGGYIIESAGDDSVTCIAREKWCVSGPGGFHGDGTVILFAGSELSVQDQRDDFTVLAVGSDDCD